MWAWIRYRPLLPILAVALVLRLGAACGLQYALDRVLHRTYLIEGDAEGYWELATKIAGGDPYVSRNPPRAVERMPGFPLVLAGLIAAFGENRFAARIFLACLGTLGCALVLLLGRMLTEDRTALIAAGLCAVSPAMIGFSPVILSETTFAVAVLASLCGLAYMTSTCGFFADARSPSAKTPVQRSLAACLAGALCGLATFVRPSWLLFAPFFVLLAMIPGPRRVQQLLFGGLLMAAVFATLLPWALRNRSVTGHLVFTTLWAGPSLYDALNPEATGDSDMTFFERDQLNATLSEYEVDREYRRRALNFARENPGRTIELAFLKLFRFWKPWPNAPQFDRWELKLAIAVFFLPLMACAVIGAWHARRNPQLLLLSAGPIVYFTLLHMIFVGSLRYRLPAEYPLCVLAAVGIEALWTHFRNHRSRSPITA